MSAERPELVPLDAPTLVEASAGTGKTYTITTYFVRAILELGLRPEQILVLTYTKAATAELRVRSRKRIVEAIASARPVRPKNRDALHESRRRPSNAWAATRSNPAFARRSARWTRPPS